MVNIPQNVKKKVKGLGALILLINTLETSLGQYIFTGKQTKSTNILHFWDSFMFLILYRVQIRLLYRTTQITAIWDAFPNNNVTLTTVV